MLFRMDDGVSLFGVRCLMLIACLVAACCANELNPEVICLKFNNGCQPEDEIASPLFQTTNLADSDTPYIYCLDSAHPSDINCDVRMLLKSDMFAERMLISGASVDFPDASIDNASCSLNFLSGEERKWAPPPFEEARCGLRREDFNFTTERDVDSDLEEVLSNFRMANVSELIITSYIPVFGCRYRFKRVRETKGIIIPSANVTGGSAFELDSFFCSIGFGVVEGRLPETKYPHQVYYKRDGKRWRPADVWPDYHRK